MKFGTDGKNKKVFTLFILLLYVTHVNFVKLNILVFMC